MDYNEREREVKNQLLEAIKNDFIIFDEVEGFHLVEETKVVIDLLLYPKEHLIKSGFEKVWFGVEVKYINDDIWKFFRLIWQAVTYAQSVFLIEHDYIRPTFVLIFHNDDHKIDKSSYIAGLSFANLGNVGTIGLLNKSKYNPKGGWTIGVKNFAFVYSHGEYKKRGNDNYRFGATIGSSRH